MQITKRHLMGPGPSDVPAETLQALASPTVGHLDPQFCELMDEIKALQRQAVFTSSPHSYTVSAPASSAMESAMANLLRPGDEALVCVNGVFGGRLAEMARRQGANVRTIEQPWGEAVDPQRLEDELRSGKPTRLAAFVHAETSTGIRSDAQTLAGICRQYGTLSVADCVTSLGGVELRMDDWQLDVIYSGSQKCLSCVPGISPLMLSQRAWDAVEAHKSPPTTWFGDLNLLAGYWSGEGKRAYHHTAPVNAMYAWHHSLSTLIDEGLEAAWNRHQTHSSAMKTGLRALGLTLKNDEAIALPQLTVVNVPDGVDEANVRARLLHEFSLEIGAGLGEFAGKVWRIGLMGHTARRESVERLIHALGTALGRESQSALEDVQFAYDQAKDAA